MVYLDMPESAGEIMGQYANFHNIDGGPTSPVVEFRNGEDKRLSFKDEDEKFLASGGFSMVTSFETPDNLGNKKRLVAKMTVAGNIHRESRDSNNVVMDELAERNDPLVRKGRVEGAIEDVDESQMSEVLSSDLNEVISKLRELAKEKKEILEVLNKYIGEFLPKYYGTIITDSPRQEIQKVYGPRDKQLNDEQLKEVPNAETTLLEIWEDVDTRGAAEKIKNGMRDDDSRLEMQKFANGTLKMFVEEGVMIDICDMGGVECLGENAERSRRVQGLDDLVSLGDEETFVPRNTVFKDGKVKFFDTYPVNKSRLESVETQKIINIVSQANWLELSKNYLSGVQEDQREKGEYLISYLYLLKKMGADMSIL